MTTPHSDGDLGDVLADSLKTCIDINRTIRKANVELLAAIADYPAAMWELSERITMLELELMTTRSAKEKP